MGRRTSRGSDAQAGTTSIHSHQALHHSPNRSVHPHEHLPSGLLKDFRLGGEDAAGDRARLSDDISGSNDSPDGCNLSDKHETAMARPPSVNALTGAAGNVPCGGDGDEQGPSPLVTLTGPEKNVSPNSSSPLKAKNSLAEHTDSGEVARRPPSSDVRLSESTASDLSLSLTPSELEEEEEEEEDLPDGVAPEKSATSGGSVAHTPRSPDSSLRSGGSGNTQQLDCESTAPAVTSERYSMYDRTLLFSVRLTPRLLKQRRQYVIPELRR